MLNALRHHRGRHRQWARTGRRNAWCSTPCGITEVGTSVDEAVRSPVRGAQRLAASQRSARSWRYAVHVEQRDVLNALRHHRGRHTIGSLDRSSGRDGAQRLAASQRSARAAEHLRPISDTVLNALRHHRGRHQSLVERPLRSICVCSTPCGITEVGTRDRPTSRRDRVVLNALRHHRGAAPVPARIGRRSTCAQRLAASQRSARCDVRESGRRAG